MSNENANVAKGKSKKKGKDGEGGTVQRCICFFWFLRLRALSCAPHGNLARCRSLACLRALSRSLCLSLSLLQLCLTHRPIGPARLASRACNVSTMIYSRQQPPHVSATKRILTSSHRAHRHTTTSMHCPTQLNLSARVLPHWRGAVQAHHQRR